MDREHEAAAEGVGAQLRPRAELLAILDKLVAGEMAKMPPDPSALHWLSTASEAAERIRADSALAQSRPSPPRPDAGELEDLVAEAVHRGRYPDGRTPHLFEHEDRSGREYCFRIARSVLAALRTSEEGAGRG